MDDSALTCRIILNYGELLAVLGRGSAGPAAEVRRPDARGTRIAAAAGNPWFDAALVPPDALLPAMDDPLLPGCLWTVADAVPSRVEAPEIATPCGAGAG